MASILVRRIPAEIKSDVIVLANLEKRMRKLQRAVSRKRDKLICQILFGGVQVPDTLWMTLLSDPNANPDAAWERFVALDRERVAAERHAAPDDGRKERDNG